MLPRVTPGIPTIRPDPRTAGIHQEEAAHCHRAIGQAAVEEGPLGSSESRFLLSGMLLQAHILFRKIFQKYSPEENLS